MKLKINFENSVYVVDDFLGALEKEGGIVEEFINSSAIYELCFSKARKC